MAERSACTWRRPRPAAELLQILNGGDLAVHRRDAARELRVARVGHVDEVPVHLVAVAGAVGARGRPLVEHLLDAAAEDLGRRAPDRPLVLRAALGRADAGDE